MKIYFKYILILILMLLLSVSIVYAQDAPSTDATTSAGASTGTLVGAALETAGYFAQAKILAELKQVIDKLGALIYLLCIIGGIVSVALLGNPGNALWLLLGPPMFFFMINIKVNANGAEWRLGAFEDHRDLQKTLAGVEIDGRTGESVSWFFHHYNVLISDTMQQLISFVTKKDLRHQMKFMARQQIVDDMFAAEIDSSEVLQLAHLSLAQCMNEMDAARRIGLGMRDPHYKRSAGFTEAVTYYCNNYTKKNKYIPQDSAAFDLIRQIEFKKGNSSAFEQGFNPNPATCETIWNWLYESVKDISKDDFENSIAMRVNSEADIRFLEEIKLEIAEKLTQSAPDPERDFHEQSDLAENFTCPGSNAPQTISRNELVPLIFAGHLIKKVYSKDPRGQMTQQLYDRAGVQLATTGNDKFLYSNAQWNQEVVRRFRIEESAEAAKYEGFIIAMMLPYVQGAGLYVLAVTFPFFALLLIIPGKANGFFMWCALWAWLKSWDVGWALVMVADELLWVMMPHSGFFRLAKGFTGGANAGVYSDPVNVLEAAFGGDYAYNLSTYYMLLGTMITAVPMLSAQAVLGSKRAVAGIFVDGLKTIGQAFGTKVTDWIAVEQLGEIDKRRELSAARTASKQMNKDWESLSAARRGNQASSGTLPGVNMQKAVQNFSAYAKNTQMANSSDQLASNKGFVDSLRKKAGSDPDVAKMFADGKLTGEELRDHFLNAAHGNLQNINDSIDFKQFKTSIMSPDSTHAGAKYLRETFGAELGKVDSFEGLAKIFSSAKGKLEAEGQRLDDLLSKSIEANTAFLTVKGGQDFGQPTRELEAHRRQIEVMREQAEIRRGIGELGILAGIVTAPANLITLGAPINNSLMTFGTSMQASSVLMERKVSEMSIQHLAASASYAYYQASKSDEYNFYENVRAGITHRAEHWGVPFSPYQTMVKLDFAWQSAQSESAKYSAQIFSKIGVAAKEALP